MNNYILFDKILKCSLVEDTNKYDLIFKSWKRKFKFFDKYQNFVQEKNKVKPKEEIKQNIQMMLDKEEQKRKKLAELGIDYEFPGFVI
jgi:nucleolar protein 15